MTVEDLLCNISWKELSEWQALFMVQAEEEKQREFDRKAQAGMRQSRQRMRR